jgi:hypothetical protein
MSIVTIFLQVLRQRWRPAPAVRAEVLDGLRVAGEIARNW